MAYVPARSSNHGGVLNIQSTGWLATRDQRRAAREMNRMRIRGAVVTAREVAKVDAVEEVSVAALLAASEVSVLEAALAQRTPHAQHRLHDIAACSNAAMANIVLRTGRDL
jgi:hypothetical protein